MSSIRRDTWHVNRDNIVLPVFDYIICSVNGDESAQSGVYPLLTISDKWSETFREPYTIQLNREAYIPYLTVMRGLSIDDVMNLEIVIGNESLPFYKRDSSAVFALGDKNNSRKHQLVLNANDLLAGQEAVDEIFRGGTALACYHLKHKNYGTNRKYALGAGVGGGLSLGAVSAGLIGMVGGNTLVETLPMTAGGAGAGALAIGSTVLLYQALFNRAGDAASAALRGKDGDNYTLQSVLKCLPS